VVAQATSQLPGGSSTGRHYTSKQQNSLMMVVDLYSDDTATYDQTFLANYAQINISLKLKEFRGVGQSLIFGGSKDYSMRVWINPSQMASYNLNTKGG
jgi:HAE1 family hydrophobic/amphiphilic exporter-1